MKKRTGMRNRWSKRIFAGILSLAMIATSFSGDIQNLVMAKEPDPIAATSVESNEPGASDENLGSSDVSVNGLSTPNNSAAGTSTPENEDIIEETHSTPANSPMIPAEDVIILGEGGEEEFSVEEESVSVMTFGMSRAAGAPVPRAIGDSSYKWEWEESSKEESKKRVLLTAIPDHAAGKYLTLSQIGFNFCLDNDNSNVTSNFDWSLEVTAGNDKRIARGTVTLSESNNWSHDESVTINGGLVVEPTAGEFSVSMYLTPRNDDTREGLPVYINPLSDSSWTSVNGAWASFKSEWSAGDDDPRTYTIQADSVKTIYIYKVGGNEIISGSTYTIEAGTGSVKSTSATEDPSELVINAKAVSPDNKQIDATIKYEKDSSVTLPGIDVNPTTGEIIVTNNTVVAGEAKIKAYTDSKHSTLIPVNVYVINQDKDSMVYGDDLPVVTVYTPTGKDTGVRCNPRVTKLGENTAECTLVSGGTVIKRIPINFTVNQKTFDTSSSGNAEIPAADQAKIVLTSSGWSATGPITVREGANTSELTYGTDFDITAEREGATSTGTTYTVKIWPKGYYGTTDGKPITFNKTIPAGSDPGQKINIADIFNVTISTDPIYYTGRPIRIGSGCANDEYSGTEYMKVTTKDSPSKELVPDASELDIEENGTVYLTLKIDGVYVRVATVEYSANKDAGRTSSQNASVTIWGLDSAGYTGKITRSFHISKRKINDLFSTNELKVNYNNKSKFFGDDIKKNTGLTVSMETTTGTKYTLEEGKDYDVEFKGTDVIREPSDPSGVGIEIDATYSRNFTGKVNIDNAFKIIGDLSQAEFYVRDKVTGEDTLAASYSETYDGSEHELRTANRAVIARFDAENSIELDAANFDLTYENNVDAGTATVTIKGKAGKDYDLTGRPANEAARLTKSFTFKINKASIAGKEVVFPTTNPRIFKNTWTAPWTFATDAWRVDGIAPGKDPTDPDADPNYKITYAIDSAGNEDRNGANGGAGIAAGVVRVKVEGVGNYEGETWGEYTIQKADKSDSYVDANISISPTIASSITYTGEEIGINEVNAFLGSEGPVKLNYLVETDNGPVAVPVDPGRYTITTRDKDGNSPAVEVGPVDFVIQADDFEGEIVKYGFNIGKRTISSLEMYVLNYSEYDAACQIGGDPNSITNWATLRKVSPNPTTDIIDVRNSVSVTYKGRPNYPIVLMRDGGKVVPAGSCWKLREGETAVDGKNPTTDVMTDNPNYFYIEGMADPHYDLEGKTIKVLYTIKPKEIRFCKITEPVTTENNGKIEVTTTVTDENIEVEIDDPTNPPAKIKVKKTLVEGTDYTIKYNNTYRDPGEQRPLEIKGIGNYGGEETKYYKTGSNLAEDAEFYIDGQKYDTDNPIPIVHEYNGKTPTLVVKRKSDGTVISEKNSENKANYTLSDTFKANVNTHGDGVYTITLSAGKDQNYYYCDNNGEKFIELKYKITPISLADVISGGGHIYYVKGSSWAAPPAAGTVELTLDDGTAGYQPAELPLTFNGTQQNVVDHFYIDFDGSGNVRKLALAEYFVNEKGSVPDETSGCPAINAVDASKELIITGRGNFGKRQADGTVDVDNMCVPCKMVMGKRSILDCNISFQAGGAIYKSTGIDSAGNVTAWETVTVPPVTAPYPSTKYKGTKITPAVIITDDLPDGMVQLSKTGNKDYKQEEEANTSCGVGTNPYDGKGGYIKIEGQGSYEGTIYIVFEIEQITSSDLEIKFGTAGDYTKTGAAKYKSDGTIGNNVPDFVIWDNSKDAEATKSKFDIKYYKRGSNDPIAVDDRLVPGAYEIRVVPNAGTEYVLESGKTAIVGTFTVTCELSDDNPLITWTVPDAATVPAMSLKVDGSYNKEALKIALAGYPLGYLKEDDEYTVDWQNIAPGENEIIITGNASKYFTGEVKKTVTVKLNLSGDDIKVDINGNYLGHIVPGIEADIKDVYFYKDGGVVPDPLLYWNDSNGTKHYVNKNYYSVTTPNPSMNVVNGSIKSTNIVGKNSYIVVDKTCLYGLVYDLSATTSTIGKTLTFTYPTTKADIVAKVSTEFASLNVEGQTLSIGSSGHYNTSEDDVMSSYVVLKGNGADKGCVGETRVNYTINKADIGGALVKVYNKTSNNYEETSVYEVEYTGSPHVPDVQVTLNGRELTGNGTDYTAQIIGNNIDANTGAVDKTILRIIGQAPNYTGTKEIEIKIKPIEIDPNSPGIVFSAETEYTGENAEAPSLWKTSLKYNTTDLAQYYTVARNSDTPYPVPAQSEVKRPSGNPDGPVEEYDNYVKVTLAGNYVFKTPGYITRPLKITPKLLSSSDIYIDPAAPWSYYTSFPQEMKYSVKDRGIRNGSDSKTLTENDYKLESVSPPADANNKVTAAGTYKIALRGRGNYDGYAYPTYEIRKRAIQSKSMTITVKYGGTEYKCDARNTTGWADQTLKPTEKDTNDVLYYEADGLVIPSLADAVESRFQVSVTDTYIDDTTNPHTDAPLVRDRDFTCTIMNKKVGDGTACDERTSPYLLIKYKEGQNNYVGEVKVFFSIGKPLGDYIKTLHVRRPYFTYDGKPHTVTKDDLVWTLNANMSEPDFVVKTSETDIVNQGKKVFYLEGTGDFYGRVENSAEGGSIETWYKINPRSVSKDNVTIKYLSLEPEYDFGSDRYYRDYTGMPIEPMFDLYVYDVSGSPLAKGTDYTVSYENCTNVSTSESANAKIYVTMKGNYAGTWNNEFTSFWIRPVEMNADTIMIRWNNNKTIFDYDGGTDVATGEFQVLDKNTLNTIPNTEYEIDYAINYGVEGKEKRRSTSTPADPFKFNAGEMSLIVTGKNNYSGIYEEKFIVRGDLSNNAHITKKEITEPFYIKDQVPIPTLLKVECAGTELNLPELPETDNGEFKLTFTGTANNSVGQVKIEALNTPYFKGTATFTFGTIKSVANLKFDYENGKGTVKYLYNGEPINLVYTATINGKDVGIKPVFTFYRKSEDPRHDYSADKPVEPIDAGDYVFTAAVEVPGAGGTIETVPIKDKNENTYCPVYISQRTLSKANGIAIGISRRMYYTGAAVTLPYIHVYYNGKELLENVDYEKVVALDYENNIEAADFDETLRLRPASVSITGKGNYSGKITDYFAINPTPANGLSIKEKSATSLRVGWNLVGNTVGAPKVRKWHIEWKEANAPSSVEPQTHTITQAAGSSGTNYYDLPNLKTGTSYTITVYSESDNGSFSEKLSVTDETTRDVKVTNVMALQTDGTTARLNWKAIPGCSGYEVVRSNEKNGIYRLQIYLPETGKASYSCTSGNLKKGMTYWFKVRPFFVDTDGTKVLGEFCDAVSVTIR